MIQVTVKNSKTGSQYICKSARRTVKNITYHLICRHKEIENELGYWGDIIRENPDRYAYVRQHFSNDVCDLKPITYSALWNLLLHSEANDLYYYNENHAIDETCVFYEFYYDLGFELPEDRGLELIFSCWTNGMLPKI